MFWVEQPWRHTAPTSVKKIDNSRQNRQHKWRKENSGTSGRCFRCWPKHQKTKHQSNKAKRDRTTIVATAYLENGNPGPQNICVRDCEQRTAENCCAKRKKENILRQTSAVVRHGNHNRFCTNRSLSKLFSFQPAFGAHLTIQKTIERFLAM